MEIPRTLPKEGQEIKVCPDKKIAAAFNALTNKMAVESEAISDCV